MYYCDGKAEFLVSLKNHSDMLIWCSGPSCSKVIWLGFGNRIGSNLENGLFQKKERKKNPDDSEIRLD